MKDQESHMASPDPELVAVRIDRSPVALSQVLPDDLLAPSNWGLAEIEFRK
ncbi:MAG: hypothetical protein LBI48_09050 [Burkholderiaceae bacterium]|nr:hypothetical protein [Burkholderiaceae bacterium]